jgi:hypothetical protein
MFISAILGFVPTFHGKKIKISLNMFLHDLQKNHLYNFGPSSDLCRLIEIMLNNNLNVCAPFCLNKRPIQ